MNKCVNCGSFESSAGICLVNVIERQPNDSCKSFTPKVENIIPKPEPKKEEKKPPIEKPKPKKGKTINEGLKSLKKSK